MISKKILFPVTRLKWSTYLLVFISSFTGIGLIGFLSSYFLDYGIKLFIIGSFGATAVIVFGTPKSDFAKQKKLLADISSLR
jgi:CBS-domain-containing membrane protein